MNRDIRIDVIYFCTPADWQFESELHGGIYNLRLLTQNASTKAEAIHALSRAVSRSEMILLVGGFYGEIYLPATVASAIGFSCQRIGLAGAAPEETLVFPVGAMPFALDGRLRGAALSRGPQTIFFLDEEREGRIRLTRERLLPDILTRYALDDTTDAPSTETTPAASSGQEEKNAAAVEIASSEPLSREKASPMTLEEKTSPTVSVESIKSEHIVLTTRRSSASSKKLPHIPQVEELTAPERQILSDLPKLRLSADREGKIDHLPENVSFKSARSKPLPRTHVELKDIRISSATSTGCRVEADPQLSVDVAAELPSVELEKLHTPDAEGMPKPGDLVQPVPLSDVEAFSPPEETSALSLGRVAKLVLLTAVIALLLLALWSGYRYFAADSEAETATAPIWTAALEGDGETAW